ncbi:hypothetical protein, partial [Pseudomonas sp. GD03944]|uniref:hypothetical protein n=1 Tax=Pseudomonas sp. GD03944 TaxID=2975409 RepID=UPI00244D628F
MDRASIVILAKPSKGLGDVRRKCTNWLIRSMACPAKPRCFAMGGADWKSLLSCYLAVFVGFYGFYEAGSMWAGGAYKPFDYRPALASISDVAIEEGAPFGGVYGQMT